MKTAINIQNGGVSVKNSPDYTPNCIDVATHCCGRDVDMAAKYWPACVQKSPNGDMEREEYISFEVRAMELPFERSNAEDSVQRCTEQVTFLDIRDARRLRDVLDDALEEAARVNYEAGNE